MHEIKYRVTKDVFKLCLSFLTEEEIIYSEGDWYKFAHDIYGGDVCGIAARNGWLELLKWAHTNNFKWSFVTFSEAAGKGNIDVLTYLRDNNCDYDSRAYDYAAQE